MTDHAQDFLNALAAKDGRPIPAGRIALVVAHPDDETIALGGRMSRLPGLVLVHVTDGAPRAQNYAGSGFDGPEAYAAARRHELERALAVGGASVESIMFGVADQDAMNRLPAITRRLIDLFRERGVTIVITHAYEGGHPDHDSTAFAVHAAQALLEREGAAAPAILEAPFYRVGSGRPAIFLIRALRWFRERGGKVERVTSGNGPGCIARLSGKVLKPLGARRIQTRPSTSGTNGKARRFIQARLREWTCAVHDFEPWPGIAETAIVLSPAEAARKKAMLDAHVTQRQVVAGFPTRTDRLRPAPAYDFSKLPNGGSLLYETFGWGIDGRKWLASAQAALDALGLQPRP